MVDSIYAWGIEFIRTIQWVQGPAINSVFKGFSFLGEDIAYLGLVVGLWCFAEPRIALRIAYPLFISFYLNAWGKDLFAQPRPYEIGDVLKLGKSDGYGIPSGHSQSSFVFWTLLTAYYPSKSLGLLATFLIVAIGFSRAFLGVHFPTDVLAGWLIGGAIVWAALTWGDRIERAVVSAKPRVRILGMALLGAALLAIHRDATSIASVTFAFSLMLGLSWTGIERARASGTLPGAVLTLSGVALLYLGLFLAFPRLGEPGYLIFRSIRYGLIAFWISGIAPRIAAAWAPKSRAAG